MKRELTIADVARYPRPGMAGPKKLQFRPDGQQVNYLASGGEGLVQQLWAYDIQSGQHIQLTGETTTSTTPTYSREEELRRERSRTRETGITDYQYAKAA